MTAQEIRETPATPTPEALWLQEIAAQLAEMNERAREKEWPFGRTGTTVPPPERVQP